MKYYQTTLPIWKKDYDLNWLIGSCNEQAYNAAMHFKGQICISGPAFSGKKHLAWIISKHQKTPIYQISKISDLEMIKAYDEAKSKNESAIWIYDIENSINDVKSRINSMIQATINELSEDLLFPLLDQRLTNLGFDQKDILINYFIYRMPRTFKAMQNYVYFLNSIPNRSRKNLKEFMENHWFLD
jgi:hypothetical protein